MSLVKITPDLLVAAVGCTTERAERFAPHLAHACSLFAINTPARLAAFLAQIGHESGAFRYVREIWGPTPAQQRYEGRADLGNMRPGDGQRFMGRGLIQTTGRYNYARLRDRLRLVMDDVPDFEARPEALELPEWAALSAADYWDMRSLNALADAGDFDRITQLINGGQNGREDRRARWQKAKAALATIAAPAPAPEPVKAYTNTQESGEPMPAPIIATAGKLLLHAALPSLIEKIPVLNKVPKPVVEQAAAIAVEAVGGGNVQATLERLEADPNAAAEASKAIESRWFEIVEVGGGGIAGARQFLATAAASPHGEIVWKTLRVVTLSALAFLAIANMIAIGAWGSAIWRGVGIESATQFVSQVLTADIGAALTAIGFWLGSSFGSKQKDEQRAVGSP